MIALQKTKKTDYGEVIETIRVSDRYLPLIKRYDLTGVYNGFGKIRAALENNKGGLIKIIA